MEKFKFALFSIISVVVVGVLAYWAIVTIQSGTEYVAEQKIKQLERENKDLEKETADLKSKLAVLERSKEGEQVSAETQPVATSVSLASSTTVYKNQSLIDELEKLASSNILLKIKSQGPSVGTVQSFLNIYNKTSNRVDNDYGGGTESAVKVFQKDQGLSSDGEAGAGTFKKMIDWLKKQG